MAHHGLLHYLGLFTLYTLLAIGAIYALYWYLRKSGGVPGMNFGKKGNGIAPLEVESMMTLEARKNLYVVKSGNERFLIATSMEGTQFLSKLESDIPATANTPVQAAIAMTAPSIPTASESVSLPFEDPAPMATDHRGAAKTGTLTPPDPETSFGGRLLHSLRWLADARIPSFLNPGKQH